MTVPLFQPQQPGATPEDRLAELDRALAANEAARIALIAERREVSAEVERRKIDALIAKLPAPVLAALAHNEPQPGDMSRLVPRGLASAITSGGRWSHTSRRWTSLGDDIRARLKGTDR